MLLGRDVVAIFPTGFEKSIIFHLLADFLPLKKDSNIVVVVCPLNAIIEDQLSALVTNKISGAVLNTEFKDNSNTSLFNDDSNEAGINTQIPQSIINGKVNLIFSHPESLLNSRGRNAVRNLSK